MVICLSRLGRTTIVEISGGDVWVLSKGKLCIKHKHTYYYIYTTLTYHTILALKKGSFCSYVCTMYLQLVSVFITVLHKFTKYHKYFTSTTRTHLTCFYWIWIAQSKRSPRCSHTNTHRRNALIFSKPFIENHEREKRNQPSSRRRGTPHKHTHNHHMVVAFAYCVLCGVWIILYAMRCDATMAMIIKAAWYHAHVCVFGIGGIVWWNCLAGGRGWCTIFGVVSEASLSANKWEW